MAENKLVPIAIILIAVFLGAMAANQMGWLGGAGTPPSANQAAATGYISTGATTLSFVTADAAQTGTAVTTTKQTSVNNAAYTTGVTSASPTDVLSILFVNNTAYHNAYLATATVPKSPTMTIAQNLNKNASITMTVFNTNNQVIDGATYNQSVTTGGAYNLAIRLDGQDKTSTQDMVCILESSDGTKMDKMTLSGLGASYVGMAKPSSYALGGANSQVWVYNVAPVAGAVSVNGVIGVQSKTSQTLAGTTAKITCLTEEYFLDGTTGKVVYGIEDSLGAAKSLASYTKTITFQ